MAATKNAHDWHCEDHDTYGWRGEECRKCPTAPSEADALRNELNRLVDLCRHMNDERLCLANGVVEMKPFPETLERGVIISEPLLREIERRYNKFKAVEAENKRLRGHIEQLREAVEEGLSTYKVPMTARICEAITEVKTDMAKQGLPS